MEPATSMEPNWNDTARKWKLSKDIFQLIQEADWVNVERRLNTKNQPLRKKAQKRLAKMRIGDIALLKQPDENNRLPLHWACSRAIRSNVKALKALIESYPASVKHRDVEGATPIHILFSGTVKSTEFVKMIINQYPDALEIRDDFGRTPIFHLVHSHIASYTDDDFPTLRLIPALEHLLRHEHASRALTIPCGPDDDHHENPRNASYTGPTHTFSNRWEDRPIEERTPLHMMWTYAIRTNTDYRTGKPVKANKKKMKVALLFLRCAYLYEINGTINSAFRRKENMSRRLIKEARVLNNDGQQSDSDTDGMSKKVADNGHSLLFNSADLSDNWSSKFSVSSPPSDRGIASNAGLFTSASDNKFEQSNIHHESKLMATHDEDDNENDDEEEQKEVKSDINQPDYFKKNAGYFGDARSTANLNRPDNDSDAPSPSSRLGIIKQSFKRDRRLTLKARQRHKHAKIKSIDRAGSDYKSSDGSIESSEGDPKIGVIPINRRNQSLRDRWTQRREEKQKSSRQKKVNDKLTKFRIIHAAITLHQCLPCEDILRISLKFCPHQLQTREEKTGFIPLHIAIIKNAGHGIIEKLIEFDIDTAQIRTWSDQLPLHLALAQPSCDMATLKCIFDAFPDAIKERDPGTKLYPFMIPAMSTDERRILSINNNIPQVGRSEHVVAASKTFELLMLCPDIHGLVLENSSNNNTQSAFTAF